MSVTVLSIELVVTFHYLFLSTEIINVSVSKVTFHYFFTN